MSNSPALLTAAGVVGALATAYLTGVAAFRSADLIAEESTNMREPRSMDGREKVELVWKEFIPPAVTACVTVTCIIMANRVGSRRIAALAAAYSLSEKGFTEYKDKVSQKFGKNKERQTRDEIAQDTVDGRPPSRETVFASGHGSELFFDRWSGRYFLSDMAAVDKAVNDVNHDILNYYAVSVNEFYDRIGLPNCEAGEGVGWNTDQLMELEKSATISEQQTACIVVSFRVAPKPHYNRHA